jgi:Neprosin
MGEQYYGAKASMNVWAPRVATESEFSLSQIWVIAGSFGNDLNTIEAGWQVCTEFQDTICTIKLTLIIFFESTS